MIVLKIAQDIYKDINYYNKKDNSFYFFNGKDEKSLDKLNKITEEVAPVGMSTGLKKLSDVVKGIVTNKILTNDDKLLTTLTLKYDSNLYNSCIKVIKDLFTNTIDEDSYEEYKELYEEMSNTFNEDIYLDMDKDILQSGINKYIHIENYLNKFNSYTEPLNAYLKLKFYSLSENDEKDLDEFIKEEFENIFTISTPNGMELPILCDLSSIVNGDGEFYKAINSMTRHLEKEEDFLDKMLEDEGNNHVPIDPKDEYKLGENEAMVRDKKGNILYIISGIYNEEMDDISISVKRL